MDSSDGTEVNAIESIEHIDPDKPYKYLGVLQTSRPHTDVVVDKVSNECLRRANIVWSSDFTKLKLIIHGVFLLLAT